MPLSTKAVCRCMVLGLVLPLGLMDLPATAQTTWQVNALVGTYLSDNDDEQFGTTKPAFALSLQRAVEGPFQGRITISRSRIGPPPCPQPPGSQTRWEIATGGIIEGIFDVAVSLNLGGMVRLEPYAGVGMRSIRAGEVEEENQAPLAFAMENNIRPLASLGGSLYLHLLPRLDGVVQVRGIRHFLGEQELTDQSGQLVERDLETVDSASLLVGLAVRF